MSRTLAVLAGAMLSLCVAPLCAQGPVPEETYGAGVHAYFSGDYRRAYDLLTSIVDTSTTDPRVYYFRGLAVLNLGREHEAGQDFQQGGKLETKNPDQTRNVSKSLERIQGSARVMLEQYRAEARMLAYLRYEEFHNAWYEPIRREESRVLQPQAGDEAPPKPAREPPASQVWFAGPKWMTVAWDVVMPGAFDSPPLVCPGYQNFQDGAIYRLKLTNIPRHPGVELHPTLSIVRAVPRTQAYLAHYAIPVEFTAEDLDEVLTGDFVTRVFYLRDAPFQGLALAGVESLVSTRLAPGFDPIVEADRRGAILAIVRFGDEHEGVPTKQGVPPAKPAQPPEPKGNPVEPGKVTPLPARKAAPVPGKVAPASASPVKKAPPGPAAEENPSGPAAPAPGPAPAPAGPTKQPAVAPKQAASPANPGNDALGWAIDKLGIKAPAGSGSPGVAVPPAKAGTATVPPATVPPSKTAPAPAKAAAGGTAAAEEGDLFAPRNSSGKKPAAGKATPADVAAPVKTPAEEEANPFGSAPAKTKSAATKSPTPAKSAPGKKPAAKAPDADADADADPGNPFGAAASSPPAAGKKAGG